MIEPVKSGARLVDEIRSTRVTAGMALWRLGQSGFAVKTAESMLYIDLYLSERLTAKYRNAPNPHVRMVRAPLGGGDIADADLVLSTHKHTDHMDPETLVPLFAASPGAKYLLPAAHVEHMRQNGVAPERMVPCTVGREFTFRDVTVVPLPAKHEAFDRTGEFGYPHLSYIVKAGGKVLYHSGDTIPYAGMAELLSGHKTDVALLPVNGRDARRHAFGTPGNCTMEEALCVAALADVKTLIPHHYDMFTFNTADIGAFRCLAAELYPALDCRVLGCGERTFI